MNADAELSATSPDSLREDNTIYDFAIIGAGPIGLACALAAQKRGLSHIVFEKGCIANSIYQYPLFMRFASTPNLLEIGEVPFVTHDSKPTRSEALEYYRRVASDRSLNVHLYEEATSVEGGDGDFRILTGKGRYRARKIVAAIGYFHRPQKLGVPGGELDKVSYYYKEPHPFANMDLLVVGGGNSAAEAALECYRHGAQTTIAVRSDDFQPGLKYWVRPDIENRIRNEEFDAFFATEVIRIEPDSVTLRNDEKGEFRIRNDFVLALIGYTPDLEFLREMGVLLNEQDNMAPVHDESNYETNVAGIYVAGVVVGGLHTDKWFIENSRAHADAIVDHAESRMGRAC